MINIVLAAVGVGVSLLQASRQKSAARRAARQTQVASAIERRQLQQQAEWAAEDRERYLAGVLGGQRAALGGAGVGGGRTGRLLAAQAQYAARVSGGRADYELHHRMQASRMGERTQVAGFRDQIRQTDIDLFGSLLSSSSQLYGAAQDYSAGRG